MEPFSIRNKIKKEYSGYGKASKELRNRLLQLHGYPYSADERNFGINNTNWIHVKKFDKDLQMHFGKKLSIEDFRDEIKTTYDNIFDFIEFYYKRAIQDLDYKKRNLLYCDICSAFKNSGSVYEFSEDGKVILTLEKETIENINVIENILEPYNDARDKFVNLCNGLIDRYIDPADAIGDMFIVFEDYLKKITSQNSFENAIKVLRKMLHPIQIKIIDNLKAYKSDVWGSVHAGNSPKPSDKEALWYLEMFLSQIKYIDRKIK